MKNLYLSLALIVSVIAANAQSVVLQSRFENFTLSPGSKLNGTGSSIAGKFSSGNAEFSNYYNTSFGGYWGSGWAYSNVKDTITSGFANLYGSYANGGANGSSVYTVGQDGSYIRITGADKGKPVKGMFVTNATFAALSMKDGDAFAKKFGGASGNDPDYFVLIIKAFRNGAISNDSVNFYLADFRFSNNSQDYIVKNWTYVDLTPLGNADSLYLSLKSSDEGQFGMNTPAFFCVDDVTTDSDVSGFETLLSTPGTFWNRTLNYTVHQVYEDSIAYYKSSFTTSAYGDYWSSGFAISNMKDTITAGYANQYSAYAGAGASGSSNYAVSQNNTRVSFKNKISGTIMRGIYLTNTTYAALSMKNGDMFAKKFGGVTGNDSDYFMVTIKAYKNGVKKSDSVNFYLADYRFADNSKDYIVKEWAWVNLASLGAADSIEFSLSSSDVGQFGMNTPAYFAFDDLEQVIPSAIDERIAQPSMTVYPNPASSLIHINIAGEIRQVTVTDLSGKTVLGSAAADLDVSSLNNGLYILSVETTEGTASQKFFKN